MFFSWVTQIDINADISIVIPKLEDSVLCTNLITFNYKIWSCYIFCALYCGSLFQSKSSQNESLKETEAISRSGRTLLQDQPSKANVPRLVKDLHYDVLKDLLILLNRESSIGNDWRKFARELGFSMLDILVLGEESNPALAVFQKWMSQDGEKTVWFLIDVLRRIERFDAVRNLEKHIISGMYSSSFKVAIFC